MRSTCDILTYFGTGLRCVYVLSFTYVYVCDFMCFFYVGGIIRLIRPYFGGLKYDLILSLTQKKRKQKHKENS